MHSGDDGLLAGSVTSADTTIAAAAVGLSIAAFPWISRDVGTAHFAVLLIMAGAGLPLLCQQAWRGSGMSESGAEEGGRRWAARAAVFFLIAAAAATALSQSPSLAIGGDFVQFTGLLFVAGLAGSWALGTVVSARGTVRLAHAIVLGAVVNGTIAIAQQLSGGSFLGIPRYQYQPTGLLGNPVFLSELLAASLVLTRRVFRVDPIRWLVPVLILAVGVGAAGERLPAAAAMGVVLIELGMGSRKILRIASREDRDAGGRSEGVRSLLFAGAVVAGLTLGNMLSASQVQSFVGRTVSATSQETYGDRLMLWRTGLSALLRHPFLGYGPGQFRSATSPLLPLSFAREYIRPSSGGTSNAVGFFPIPTDAHNIIVECGVTTGIIGLLLFVLWLVLSVRGARGPLVAFSGVLIVLGLAEPLNVVVTPLAFLALGAAAARPREVSGETEPGTDRDGGTSRRLRAAGRWSVAIGAVVGIVAACSLMVGEFSLSQGQDAFGAVLPNTALSDARLADRVTVGIWPEPATLACRVRILQALSRVPGTLRDARWWCGIAVARDPGNPDLLLRLAQVQYRLGDLRTADDSAVRAWRVLPFYPETLQFLAQVDSERSDTRGEITWLQRLLVLEPWNQSLKSRILDLEHSAN